MTEIAVIPLGASAAQLGDVLGILVHHELPHQLVRKPGELLAHDAGSHPPLLLAVGGTSNAGLTRFVRDYSVTTSFRVPVLAVVEDLTEELELALLTAGARDVLGVPNTRQRLTARITTMYRHAARLEQQALEIRSRSGIHIHLGRREVSIHDRRVEVTGTEFELLVALARRPRHVLSRTDLYTKVPNSEYLSDRALESHLSRLRSKIRHAGGPRLIECVRGVGYRLETV